MSDAATNLIVGATQGIGLEIARRIVANGDPVTITGRDLEKTRAAAAGIGPLASAVAFDLAEPHSIGPALASVGPVRWVIQAAIERDQNTVAAFDADRAIRLATLKLVGYTQVLHVIRERLTPDAAIVLFGGQAKDTPYPGSTTVSTVNGGVEGLTRSLVHELKPIRVNVVHPGIVGDSPYWETRQGALEATLARTPTGRLTTMADIVDATLFLLTNPAMNGVYLKVDGGLHAN